jgi:hypothetical protein
MAFKFLRFLSLKPSCTVLQVVSIKAIGIAIKLTLEGVSQIAYPQTWFFLTVAVICVVTQLNYLNKVSMVLLHWQRYYSPVGFMSVPLKTTLLLSEYLIIL